ncbi:MAG: DinB family protein [Croceitalea sp.]|nr:DinB family protein [Croceitalea sp.]
MDKQSIAQLMHENHQKFISKLSALSDTDFEYKPAVKWTAGQQLEHIIKSVKPVVTAFSVPLFLLKMKFGLTNRPSKTYEELVEKYLGVLEKNKRYAIPKKFAPDYIGIHQRKKKLAYLNTLVLKLNRKANRLSEKDLDTYILPHPVMGKLTLREMLYFTAYHVQHHEVQIAQNLSLPQ